MKLVLDFLPLRRLIDDQYHFPDYWELAELELGTHELFQDKYHVMNHSEMYMYGVALGDAVWHRYSCRILDNLKWMGANLTFESNAGISQMRKCRTMHSEMDEALSNFKRLKIKILKIIIFSNLLVIMLWMCIEQILISSNWVWAINQWKYIRIWFW